MRRITAHPRARRHAHSPLSFRRRDLHAGQPLDTSSTAVPPSYHLPAERELPSGTRPAHKRLRIVPINNLAASHIDATMPLESQRQSLPPSRLPAGPTHPRVRDAASNPTGAAPLTAPVHIAKYTLPLVPSVDQDGRADTNAVEGDGDDLSAWHDVEMDAGESDDAVAVDTDIVYADYTDEEGSFEWEADGSSADESDSDMDLELELASWSPPHIDDDNDDEQKVNCEVRAMEQSHVASGDQRFNEAQALFKHTNCTLTYQYAGHMQAGASTAMVRDYEPYDSLTQFLAHR